MTTPYVGFKGQLLRGNGAAPEVFALIGGLRSVEPAVMKTKVIEATAMGPNAKYMTKLAGLIDPGQGKFQVMFDPTDVNHQALQSDQNSGVARNFKVIYPDGVTFWIFSALVTGYAVKLAIDNLMTADIDLEITGEPTFEAGVVQ